MNEIPLLASVLEAYSLKNAEVHSFGTGHIHQTFLLTHAAGQYILQHFNNQVFRNPDSISHNHAVVLTQMDKEKLPYVLPLPIPNEKGDLFTKVENQFFRLSPFVAGKCVGKVENTKQAYLAAKAFAQFIQAGIHIDAAQFQEAIPGFHDLELRYNQLLDALAKTQRTLEGELQDLIDFYQNQKPLVEEYLYWKKKLPLRLTHNDTKIDNLIFSEDFTQVNAVIDLDTIMGGYVYFDFGDLVRTVACTKEESSTSWDQIAVDSSKYEAMLKGFIEIGNGVFTPDEIESLSFGGPMMTCIMGFRFLTDYLLGNIYYTIHYPEQNFHRAKNQMCLLKALLKNR